MGAGAGRFMLDHRAISRGMLRQKRKGVLSRLEALADDLATSSRRKSQTQKAKASLPIDGKSIDENTGRNKEQQGATSNKEVLAFSARAPLSPSPINTGTLKERKAPGHTRDRAATNPSSLSAGCADSAGRERACSCDTGEGRTSTSGKKAFQGSAMDMVSRAKVKLRQADERRAHLSSGPRVTSPSMDSCCSPQKYAAFLQQGSQVTRDESEQVRALKAEVEALRHTNAQMQVAAHSTVVRSPSIPNVCARDLPADVCAVAADIYAIQGKQVTSADEKHLAARTPRAGVGPVATFLLDDYESTDANEGGQIGEGSYSTVTTVRSKQTGVVRCLKKIKTLESQADLEYLCCEIALLHLASRHEFIVSFYGYCVRPGAVYLCMQKMDATAQEGWMGKKILRQCQSV